MVPCIPVRPAWAGMQGKRSTLDVRELAEEIRGGAFGGVFASGIGYVGQLGRSRIDSLL